MSKDLKYFIAISTFQKIGPVRFKKLYNYFDSMKKAWHASIFELKKSGLEEKIAQEFIIKRQEINPDLELEKLTQENIQVITILDQGYPKILKEIHNPPALLYTKGNLSILNSKNNLAVVGTRKISNYGKQTTPDIVKPLINKGFTIVSGLALGVDALAHQTCIENNGKTIAVLGCGIDEASLYPTANRYLAKNIIKNKGLIISEFPIKTPPLKQNFPSRNRIISGLSLGTIVIEAGERSGSIITAYIALEQNREVFAVPGSIYNQTSIGTNKLIQKGAKLITSHNDILEELNLSQGGSQPTTIKKSIPTTIDEKLIIENLNLEPTHINEIIKQCNLNTSQVNSLLSQLELKGLIKNLGNQNYILLN